MIELKKFKEFNIEQICTCGQLFRYKKTNDGYVIYETDQKIVVRKTKEKIIIETKNKKRHENYFDLFCNYARIKQELKTKSKFLASAIEFGEGIRILKQDVLETTISFIISANNNILRIQKTIELICLHHGKNCGDYFAFPSLLELSGITKEQFISYGAGYRAEYLVETIKMLNGGFNLDNLKSLPTDIARKELMRLPGVGPKVADCILLFAIGKKDVFPADTWVKKVYHENFGGAKNEKTEKVSKFFTNLFKENSGAAQQYMFYFKRENGKRGL